MYDAGGGRRTVTSLRDDDREPLARLNKLVLNGWDDANDNSRRPSRRVPDASHRAIRALMMAERALTGELGIDQAR